MYRTQMPALTTHRRTPSKGRPMLPSQNKRQPLFAEIDPTFRRDVLKGLCIKPRTIPARWLYDRRGSELFEAITALPEYYPTRTECSILSSAVSEIAALIGPK